MNEVVTDGVNGLLVAGIQDGTAKSGIPAFSPDVAELARAFDRLADPELRAQLAEGSRRLREELSWSRTVDGFRDILRGPANLRGFMNDKALTPAPFVVGVGRSGTTMLRLMLDAHPELTIPPETHFVPDLIELFEERRPRRETAVDTCLAEDRRWGDFDLDAEVSHERVRAARAVRRRRRRCAPSTSSTPRSEGKPRWGEKTPDLRRQDGRDRERAARGALHPRDPRRPRRRALADQALG